MIITLWPSEAAHFVLTSIHDVKHETFSSHLTFHATIFFSCFLFLYMHDFTLVSICRLSLIFCTACCIVTGWIVQNSISSANKFRSIFILPLLIHRLYVTVCLLCMLMFWIPSEWFNRCCQIFFLCFLFNSRQWIELYWILLSRYLWWKSSPPSSVLCTSSQ